MWAVRRRRTPAMQRTNSFCKVSFTILPVIAREVVCSRRGMQNAVLLCVFLMRAAYRVSAPRRDCVSFNWFYLQHMHIFIRHANKTVVERFVSCRGVSVSQGLRAIGGSEAKEFRQTRMLGGNPVLVMMNLFLQHQTREKLWMFFCSITYYVCLFNYIRLKTSNMI